MAHRLYRTDSYLAQFSAHIVERLTHDGSPALILDQTAFYPTAGGQPHDLGVINGVRVADVIERDDGEIVHVLAPHADGIPAEKPVGLSTPSTGSGQALNDPEASDDDLRLVEGRTSNDDESVNGLIDWQRRFDHMQQHSGQHVLSQAFVRAANLDTVAVHIGAEENTLDLATPRLSPDVIEQVEREANAIVMEDRPFVVYEVTDADLVRVPLRKPPQVTGLVRIVEVKDYDWSACGGTHVRNAAQIGLLKITKAETRGGKTRVTFRCGRRAFEDYSRLNAATNRLMESLSASRYEVEAAINKMLAVTATNRKVLQEAQAKLITYEAAELSARTPPTANGTRLIVQAFEVRDPAELRALAKQLTATPRTVVLLGTAGDKSQLIFARSKDAQGEMSAMLKRALFVLSPDGKAKGGGSADFAQGGGVPANLAQVQAAIEAAQEAAQLS